MKNIQEKNFSSLKAIKVLEEGKRFESYIGWSFCKELKCEKYYQGIDYSLKEEKDYIINILNNNKIESDEKNEIINNLNEYEKGLNELKSMNSSSNITSKSESKSNKNKKSSSDNKKINESHSRTKNNVNINNKNNTINNNLNNNINNFDANNINNINNDNINKNNINNINKNDINNKDINIINNNIININNKNIANNDKTAKKNKKKEISYKRAGDIYGDIDVIIPNVKKINFIKMLENNFYYNQDSRCIVFEKEKLNILPDIFHLFIEVGLNAFHSDMSHKQKQIRKYISLINIRNKINNNIIKKIYIDDFTRRLSLNINITNKENSANEFVYMLISNSDYSSFIHRFLDNKSYEGENNDGFTDISKIAPNEFIFCGFVDFAKGINSNAFLNKTISEQNNQITEQNKQIIDQNKQIAEQNKRILNLEKNLYYNNAILVSMLILLISLIFMKFCDKTHSI